jgi:hypothetical protein
VVKADKSALVSPVQPENIEAHALLPLIVVKADKSALVSPVQPENIELHPLLPLIVVKALISIVPEMAVLF